MTMIAVRDVELYVEDTGTGPVLLFIHGMCGNANVWDGQVERVRGRFRCITYDRRGHTRSTRGHEPESPETHADDAAALISALGVRPVVVGSSGGARIAVALARRYPECSSVLCYRSRRSPASTPWRARRSRPKSPPRYARQPRRAAPPEPWTHSSR